MNPGLNIFKRAQRLQGGEEDVEAELAKKRPRRPLTKKELENEDPLIRDIIKSIPLRERFKGPQFSPRDVPVFFEPGDSLRYYDPEYSTSDQELLAQHGTGNVMDLERGNWPVSEEELKTLPDWLAHLLRGIPEKHTHGSQREQFMPRSVPVMQGPQGRYYDPNYSREDERIMAQDGDTDVEPLKLAGGSSNLPKGFTAFWPGGGRWEGPSQVAAGSNILGGHPWQYYDIGNPQAPWIGMEGPRGSLGQWVDIPGESRRGRVIDVKQKGYGGYGILKKGQYDRKGNYIPGSGGGGAGGTIPGGPFQGWTPEAMGQWHEGTPPSGMNYPEFTGNTAGPGGQQLAYETTSYNIPGYGWVPRATLNNAQASNNLWDYLNPWGGTSKGGSNTGDPTQRGIGMAVGTASNFIIPGLGFVTGPIARWITSKFQGQNPTPKQVQQAVQQAQAQGKLPPMPKGSVPLPTQPGQGGSGNFSPSYLRSIGYTPGQGTGSLWPGGGGVGGGSIGGGGSFYGGNLAPHWGSTAIGFGGSYGGGSNAGDTSRFMSGAGYNRPYSAEQWANMRGSKKYAAPTLSTAEGGITPQIGYDQYLQMFHPIGSVGSSTGPGGAAYSGGGPQGIGGGKTSFKPNLNQKVFAMGTSNVNPGLKIFHQTTVKRKETK